MNARDAGVSGFSLVELLIAMAMMVAFGSVVMALIIAGQSMARMQPEAADLHQRARIALQTLGAELAVAGAGFDRGPLAGSLARHFPPVELTQSPPDRNLFRAAPQPPIAFGRRA